MHTGISARILENAKRRKYPGITVTPFALEAYGQLGESALSFLRSLARGLSAAEQGPHVSKVMQSISSTMQRHNARIVIAATVVTT